MKETRLTEENKRSKNQFNLRLNMDRDTRIALGKVAEEANMPMSSVLRRLIWQEYEDIYGEPEDE